MSVKQFDTSGFTKERAEIEEAGKEMVFGRAGAECSACVPSRIALLGIPASGVGELGKLVAERLGMELRLLEEASTAEEVSAHCAAEGVILVPPLAILSDASVREALRTQCRVFFIMVNPARIAASLGLSGEAGEAFCREAMAYEGHCLETMHLLLPDGHTPKQMLFNVLEGLGLGAWGKDGLA